MKRCISKRYVTTKLVKLRSLNKWVEHEKADQNFYITANLVMNLAARAREIFESSEVDEKRQLLDLVFQNLQLKDANLSVSVREPFLTMMDHKNRPGEWGRCDSNTEAEAEGFTVAS